VTVHYSDSRVTLHHGDCLDVLRALPDNSVDSVVTDPPYGLEFMGKEWDRFDDRPEGQTQTDTWGQATTAIPGSAYASTLPRYRGKQGASLKPFQDWCEAWATEALRVLKPGGHLLAFGGTRTWHRLGCAVEDAGFEVRDSIAWLYGSGFPKSLDVSKAIDKAAGREAADTEDRYADAFRVTRWLRSQVEARGLTSAAVNTHFDAANIAQEWLMVEMGKVKRPRVPRWDQWEELRRWLDLPDDMDADVWRLNGMKGTPAPLAFAREAKVYEQSHGFARVGLAHGAQQSHTATAQVEELGYATGPGDEPATDAAREWAGWGTALKPAHEPVVWGVKPLDDAGIRAEIGSQLEALEWVCRQRASAAASSSAHTLPDSPAATTATAPASAATQPEADPVSGTATGEAAGSFAVTATSASESTAETFSSTVTSWRACWAEISAATSTSTTSTATSRTTDLRTLSSCLSQITQHATGASTLDPGSWSSLVTAADSLFGAGVLSSRSTLALSAIEPATASTGTGSLAAFEPVVVARKPLTGTVAGNVQAWGTGALNIDGCRIESSAADKAAINAKHAGMDLDAYERKPGASLNLSANPMPLSGAKAHDAGRWPANVILDEDQAAALDEQSGMSEPKAGRTGRQGGRRANGVYSPDDPDKIGTWPADPGGGASRFFFVAGSDAEGRPGCTGHWHWPDCDGRYGHPRGEHVPPLPIEQDAERFLYQAKAPKRERPVVDGTSHPTVKPLALMRWLVRLVTPPGGVVLEPFAGSGTTVEACIVEGFRCVAIEKGDEYLPLIVERIARQDRARIEAEVVRESDPEAAIVEQFVELGLFDIEEPA
jgi:DNA modification methylase